MPEISRFFGMVISMNYRDHPPPHFHVRHGGHRASIAIHSLVILAGALPPRALGMVLEWAVLHREELLLNWARVCASEPTQRIPPLE
jgi:hypothetical protein